MSLQRLTCTDTSGEVLTHVCEPCNRELGRVRGVIMFDGSFDIAEFTEKMKTTSEEAVALFETAVENGSAVIISETTGTYDGGSPQTGDGYRPWNSADTRGNRIPGRWEKGPLRTLHSSD